MKKLCVVLFVLSLLPLTVAHGVTTITNIDFDSDNNTVTWSGSWNSAATGVGLENSVGQVGGGGGGSGIYLGNGWVISAGHVGAQTFTLGGQNYSVVTNSQHSLFNDNLSQVDLVLFQISLTVELPSVAIYNGTVSAGQNVTMIGYGGDPRQFGRGVNSITSVGSGLFSDSGFSSLYFQTNISGYDGGAAGNYTQALVGDSGGAGFVYNSVSEQWELAGIMISIASLRWEGFAGTVPAVTYFVDLTQYYDQIGSIVAAPEPATWALLLSGAGALWLAARRWK